MFWWQLTRKIFSSSNTVLYCIEELPKTLPVPIHPVQSLDDNLVLVEVLLQLVGLARDLPLLVPHGVEAGHDLLLRLALHRGYWWGSLALKQI